MRRWTEVEVLSSSQEEEEEEDEEAKDDEVPSLVNLSRKAPLA